MVETASSYPSLFGCKIPYHRLSQVLIASLHSPYYIWIGRPRSCDIRQACHAFEIEGGNLIGNCSPILPSHDSFTKMTETVPPLEIGPPIVENKTSDEASPTVIDITPPLSSFHYQVGKVRGCSFIHYIS